MPTRVIVCANCGLRGEIEVQGLNGVPVSLMFRHLGHNPYSGHMHYQCPSCEVVLLVDPMDVLGKGVISGLPGRPNPDRESRLTATTDCSDLSLLKRIFRQGWMEH